MTVLGTILTVILTIISIITIVFTLITPLTDSNLGGVFMTNSSNQSSATSTQDKRLMYLRWGLIITWGILGILISFT